MTTHCISISAKPGTFGATFHNEGYRLLGLDFAYTPLRVGEDELPAIIKRISREGIRGCSVSMPFKVRALEYVDALDERARRIGAVNTIVNEGDRLVGYNTDYDGAAKALERLDLADKRVLLIGAGGAARAISLAVIDAGGALTIVNRNEGRAHALAGERRCRAAPFADIAASQGYLLINATSVGMNEERMIVGEDVLSGYAAVMDAVQSPPETLLIRSARTLGKTVVTGLEMTTYQAAAQFRLYTGHEAPPALIERILAGAA